MDKIELIFQQNNGYVRTDDMLRQGIAYSSIKKYIAQGKIRRIRRGLYRWCEVDEDNDIAMIRGFFSDAIFCMNTALYFRGYTDRTPNEWHVAVDKDSSKKRFDISYPAIQPYFLEKEILSIGVSLEEVNGVKVKIYDRERIICDCFRYYAKMDREIFNKAIQAYIQEPKKNLRNLSEYAKRLKVYKKVQYVIGMWL